MINYSLSGHAITINFNGQTHSFTDDPAKRIALDAIEKNDISAIEKLVEDKYLYSNFRQLGEVDQWISHNKKELSEEAAELIFELQKLGLPFDRYLKFFEKLELHNEKEIFNFLRHGDCTLTKCGKIVAYKPDKTNVDLDVMYSYHYAQNNQLRNGEKMYEVAVEPSDIKNVHFENLYNYISIKVNSYTVIGEVDMDFYKKYQDFINRKSKDYFDSLEKLRGSLGPEDDVNYVSSEDDESDYEDDYSEDWFSQINSDESVEVDLYEINKDIEIARHKKLFEDIDVWLEEHSL